MNIYLKQMKDALTSYYEAAKAYEKDVEQVKKTYQPDIADKKLDELNRRRIADFRAAETKINEARDKGIEEARRWGRLDGNDINDADLKLLKLDISPEQFSEIAERNRKNGTMAFALSQYAKERGWLDAAAQLPSVDSKIDAYTRFASGALTVLASMSQAGSDIESVVYQVSVEHFGEPGNADTKLLRVLE